MTKTVNANLSNKKDQKVKRSLKQTLLQPHILSWPQLDKGVVPYILSQFKQLILDNSKPDDNSQVESTKKVDKKSTKKSFFKNQLVFGIREVTKGLERDSLSLVLVCKSTTPTILTRHLIGLAATTDIRAACIPDLSITLAPLVGLKSCLALGVRKGATNSEVKTLTTNTRCKLKPLTLPWNITQQTTYTQAQVCFNIKTPKKQTN